MKMKSVGNLPSIAWLLAVAILSAQSAAWAGLVITATSLHPTGATDSRAYAVLGTNQVGQATFGTNAHAALWSGTSNTFVDLHHSGTGFTDSAATTLSQTNQAGYVGSSGFVTTQAAIWSGTADSFTNVNPTGATGSAIFGMSSSNAVGYATYFVPPFGSFTWGGLWPGTSNAFINLNRGSMFSSSEIFATTGTKHVGMISVIGYDAALWTGITNLYVDLNPSNAIQSYAYGVSDLNQVGYAVFGGTNHAALWCGNADSFVDLNPPGATSSYARATCGSQQAGAATFNGVQHAVLWCGTAASCADLHASLGLGYAESKANGIWSDGQTVYVVGEAHLPSGVSQAILWTVREETFSLVYPGCDGTNFSFSIETHSNQTYTIEYNDDLRPANWHILETLNGDGSLMPCCVPVTNANQRFFRVRHP